MLGKAPAASGNKPSGASKAPLGAHLRQVAKTKRKDPEQLVKETLGEEATDQCPATLEWHWNTFCELSRQRPRNGWVACAIPFTELLAWATLARVSLSPFDIEVIMALDREWLDVNAK